MERYLQQGEDGFFRTTDILLAALLNQLYGIERLEKDSNNRYLEPRFIFVFKESDELKKTVGDWTVYKTNVEPRKFYASVKQLKSLTTLYQSGKS